MMNLEEVNSSRVKMGRRRLGWWIPDLLKPGTVVVDRPYLPGLEKHMVYKSGDDYRWGRKRLDKKNGNKYSN